MASPDWEEREKRQLAFHRHGAESDGARANPRLNLKYSGQSRHVSPSHLPSLLSTDAHHPPTVPPRPLSRPPRPQRTPASAGSVSRLYGPERGANRASGRAWRRRRREEEQAINLLMHQDRLRQLLFFPRKAIHARTCRPLRVLLSQLRVLEQRLARLQGERAEEHTVSTAPSSENA